MEDNFDKKLSDRIKEVSSANEIPYNAAHWNMLQEKMNNKKKRIFFYWKIAAILLISLLVGGLGKYYFKESSINKNYENPQIILDTKNDSLRVDSIKTNTQIFITSSEIDTITNNNSKLSKVDSTKPTRNKKFQFKQFKSNSNLESNIAKNKETVVQKDIKLQNTTKADSLKQIIDNKLNNKLLADVGIETTTKNKDLDSILNSKEIKDNSVIQRLNKDSLAFKKDLLTLLKEEKETGKKDLKKSLKFGLEVSPIFDYNQDNGSSNVGFSGGIIVEIPISNKFDLNTGVFYSDQKLNLNESAPLYSDVVSARSSSQLIEEEAVIKGIEIPLNVKYNFSIAKKHFFIAAGVTSTSYIKENIESNYLVNGRTETSTLDNSGNNIVKYQLVQTNSKITTLANSSTFNFANYLNLSVGLKLPINKERQAIIIAPYFKYSLKPLTQQQIDFNSGGVHLRYNFSFSKNN